MKWYKKIGVAIFIILLCVPFVNAYSEFNDANISGWLRGTEANFTKNVTTQDTIITDFFKTFSAGFFKFFDHIVMDKDLNVTKNIIAENITANEHLFGNLSWINLSDYPVACTSGSWISQLSDSTTCTAPGTLGPFVSWSGYNLEFNSSELNDTLTYHYQVNRSGNVGFGSNVTAENVFLPSFIFAHTDVNITSLGSGFWHNITFYDEVADPKRRITHTYTDYTNDTFIIVDDGYYNINYHLSFADIAASPTGHIIARVVKNGAEISGSLREKDTTKQNADTLIGHGNILVYLATGDEIVFQFATDDTTITLSSHATYGDHKDTAVITMERMG